MPTCICLRNCGMRGTSLLGVVNVTATIAPHGMVPGHAVNLVSQGKTKGEPWTGGNCMPLEKISAVTAL